MNTNEGLDMKAAAKTRHESHHYRRNYECLNTSKLENKSLGLSQAQRKELPSIAGHEKRKKRPLNSLELDVYRRKQYNKLAEKHLAPLGTHVSDNEIKESLGSRFGFQNFFM
jgi:hypothetical protein